MRLKRNLDQVIYDALIDSLYSAQWKSGDIINIDELAAKYEVSRTPVVQAIRMMAVDGIVELLPNGRATFPTFTEKDVDDLCFTRELLERAAIKVICKEKPALPMEELTAIIAESKVSRANKDFSRSCRLDIQFHKTIIGVANNQVLSSVYEVIQKRFTVLNYLNRAPEQVVTDLALAQHEEILRELPTYNYSTLDKLVRRHVEYARRSELESVASK